MYMDMCDVIFISLNANGLISYSLTIEYVVWYCKDSSKFQTLFSSLQTFLAPTWL